MEEIIDEIISNFNFDYFCPKCMSVSEDCLPPSYCARLKVITDSVASSDSDVNSMINQNQSRGDSQTTNISSQNKCDDLKLILDPNFTQNDDSRSQDESIVQTSTNPLTRYFRYNPKDRKIKMHPEKGCLLDIESCRTAEDILEESDMIFGAMNPGGLNATKSKVIEKLVRLNKIKVLVISETAASGNDIPFVSNDMQAFHRNRSNTGPCKGGVAVFVNKEIAKDCVIIDKGTDDMEFVAVRMNCFVVPVVVVGLYGRQETGAREEIRRRWRKLFGIWNKYKEDGNIVLMMGDWNCAVGRAFGLDNNDPTVSCGGKEVIKAVVEDDWHMMNKLYHGDKNSHFDRTAKTSRCLDYVMCSEEDIVTGLSMDEERFATPYNIIMEKGKAVGRKFTDHRTIIFSTSLKPIIKPTKTTPRFIKSESSIKEFERLTDEIGVKMLEELETGKSMDVIVNKTKKLLLKAKYSAYQVMKPSKAKAEVLEDRDIFFYNTDKLEREEENIRMMRVNNQIYKVRKEKLLGERNQEVFAMVDKEGNVAETKEGVMEILMDHNEKLLSRQEHPAEFKEIFELKHKMMEDINVTNFEEFNTITWEEFEVIVKKITRKNKQMFHDFIQSGSEFKKLVFEIVKKIYETEDIPESFTVTVLVALFKKGDPRLADNYRYLHLKEMLARILEMVVYSKLEVTFDKFTGDTQQGGMKGGDTLEHLCLTMSLINKLEKEGGGAIITCCDVCKCFDCCHQSDMNFFLIKNKCDLKALKVFQKLTGTNHVKVQGAESTFTIVNGEGQGGNVAPRATSAGITEAIERYLQTHPKPVIYNKVNCTCDCFVDDMKMTDLESEGAKASGRILTKALDELALSAHEKKTVQIVVGSPDYIVRMKEELEKNPTIVQNFQVSVVQAEKYLGMVICSGGVKDIIDANIEAKRKAIAPVAQKIRKLTESPMIKRIGRLKAASLLIQAQLIPKLLYGTEAWVKVTKGQYKNMEDILRDSICTIISLPKTTNYEAMLAEVSNFHVEQWMDLMKLQYFNKKMNLKESGRFVTAMKEEVINGDKGGFYEDVTKLCEKYDVPNVMLHYLRPDDLSYTLKEFSKDRICHETLLRKSVPIIVNTRKVVHSHHLFNTMEARAITCFNTGNLVFKATRGWEMPPKYQGDKWCMFRQCEGVDSYHHARYECDWYDTKYVEMGDPVADNARFLVELDRERKRRWKVPLIVVGGYL